MSRNTVLRLLVFFLGIPLLALTAITLPAYHLPVFALLVFGASALAASEAAFFFPPQVRDYGAWRIVIPLLGALIPVVGYLIVVIPPVRDSFPLSDDSIIHMTVIITVALIMGVQVFKRRETEIFQIINVVSTHLFLLVYPGLFAWHVIRILGLPGPSVMLIVFILAVYLNDSFAWVAGRLLGPLTRRQGSPPPVAVSPNKSIAGFIGGFLASPLVIIVAARLFPQYFPGGLFRQILFGALIGVTSIVGDLVESALKRAATVKDSGQIIPGRGGLLDSIDSPLFTAPFFYYGYVVIFGI